MKYGAFEDPSTGEAKFKRGTHGGRLGARERQTKNGKMLESLQAIKDSAGYGLPQKIRGNPLGCGCQVAHLSSVSAVKDGLVEADYQCDASWHNYVVFEVRQNTNLPENSIKIGPNGELVEGDPDMDTAELEEF